MKPPFDIAGDLDTPVSAFIKLKSFRPSFLLESVEGGERLGRYSFVGFGEALELRLDRSGVHCGGEAYGVPAGRDDLLGALRNALARAPRPTAEGADSGFPLAGGLVGYSSYDVVRYFEKLPRRVEGVFQVPDLHYVAPRSLLVFVI